MEKRNSVISHSGKQKSTLEESLSLDTAELLIDLGNNVKMTLIKIKAGSFMMGSPEGELGKEYNETQHSVTLTKDYWLGKYPVIQREYKAVMGRNPSAFNDLCIWSSDDDCLNWPVENVSWILARMFCNRLNKMLKPPANFRFDLPTEAQWEYACRAGTTTALNSGKNITHVYGKCVNLARLGWYDNNSIAYRSVGKKHPNAWGLFDMHGNVMEWCRDWYEWEYASDPEFLNGQEKGEYRVARGGCHRSDPLKCRSASRECFEPTTRDDYIGFRLALVSVK